MSKLLAGNCKRLENILPRDSKKSLATSWQVLGRCFNYDVIEEVMRVICSKQQPCNTMFCRCTCAGDVRNFLAAWWGIRVNHGFARMAAEHLGCHGYFLFGQIGPKCDSLNCGTTNWVLSFWYAREEQRTTYSFACIATREEVTRISTKVSLRQAKEK